MMADVHICFWFKQIEFITKASENIESVLGAFQECSSNVLADRQLTMS